MDLGIHDVLTSNTLIAGLCILGQSAHLKTLVIYKVNRTPFLSQRGSNTGCWSFKFFVLMEDNVINLP
jgi:hypothetical protein